MITSFDGKYSWLSNFYPCNITVDGVVYPTVEHAYQAAKTQDNAEKQKILECKTPGEAKRMGRTVIMRADWPEIKVYAMAELLEQKFSQSPFREWLVETGDQKILEVNTWGDRFWGVVELHGGGYGGLNNLGCELMRIRELLQDEIQAVENGG